MRVVMYLTCPRARQQLSNDFAFGELFESLASFAFGELFELLASPRALLLSARRALHLNVNTLTAQSQFIIFHASRRTARELCCSRMNLFILEQQSSRAFVPLTKINTVYRRYFHIWEFK